MLIVRAKGPKPSEAVGPLYMKAEQANTSPSLLWGDDGALGVLPASDVERISTNVS